jgi:GNAT superfamily N-acetyltransferase
MAVELHIRPRRPEDDPRIVEIYSDQEADSAPLTVDRLREEVDESSPESRRETWVAAREDSILGFGGFLPAWWTGDPAVFSLDLRVDRTYWRHGIGSQLFEFLQTRVRQIGGRRVMSWVRTDFPQSLPFAAGRGFRRTGDEVEDYRLCVPKASTSVYVGLEDRLGETGIRIVSLAEVGADTAFLHRLRELWGEQGQPSAGTPEQIQRSFNVWRYQALAAPGLSPETHWIALEGDRPVGTTFLKRLSPAAAENDFTAVAPSHRGRGIAPALKLRAIGWARANDIDWFYTSSEVRNHPMLTINRRLGYVPGAHRLELTGDIE